MRESNPLIHHWIAPLSRRSGTIASYLPNLVACERLELSRLSAPGFKSGAYAGSASKRLVPQAGVEPACLGAAVFETAVSANSTTKAQKKLVECDGIEPPSFLRNNRVTAGLHDHSDNTQLMGYLAHAEASHLSYLRCIDPIPLARLPSRDGNYMSHIVDYDEILVACRGFEPRLMDSESTVLPVERTGNRKFARKLFDKVGCLACPHVNLG